MPDPLPAAPLLAYFMLLLPRWQRCRVNGRSMEPTLGHGTIVLVDTAAYKKALPQVGDVVLVRHPFQPPNKMIKRITAVSEDGGYFLQGDNPDSLASTDSRSFGHVRYSHLLGKITRQFR